MFRTLLSKQRFFILKRRLHDSKLPSIEPNQSIQEKYIGIESPKKADQCFRKKEDKIFLVDSKAEYDDEYTCYYNKEN